jgi:hypothetical protein
VHSGKAGRKAHLKNKHFQQLVWSGAQMPARWNLVLRPYAKKRFSPDLDPGRRQT